MLRRSGRLFHYTGSPNKLTSGRDVPREVAKRLEQAGFKTQLALDGVLATRRGKARQAPESTPQCSVRSDRKRCLFCTISEPCFRAAIRMLLAAKMRSRCIHTRNRP